MTNTVNQLSTTGNLLSFAFESHEVRVIDQDGNPWFVAADACNALGLSNSRDAVLKLDDDEKGVASTDTLGGPQEVGVINESGLYTLILRCRDAVNPGTVPHRFRKWVTSEVLPSIRKTGAYTVPQTTGDALVQMALAYRAHERRIMSLEAEQAQTKQVIAELIGGEDYTTAKGYARTNNLPADRASLCAVGKKAAKLCKARKLHIGKVTDEAWDTVNSYPREIVAEAFALVVGSAEV